MPPDSPFIDPRTGSIDVEAVLREAIPLAKLVALVAVVALVPFAISSTLGVFSTTFAILAQFVLAVGSGVVLLYVVARGIRLAEE